MPPLAPSPATQMCSMAVYVILINTFTHGQRNQHMSTMHVNGSKVPLHKQDSSV